MLGSSRRTGIVRSLGELGTLKNGINKAAEDFGHGSPFINLMDVFGIPRVAVDTVNLGLVNTTEAEQRTYELQRGDVLFVRSSVKPEGVGLTTLIADDLPRTVFSGFLIRFRSGGSLTREFKEHCFAHDGFRRRLIASSTVSANTNINQNALRRIPICLPTSPAEQRAIAAALSDVDTLLDGLDRLIAKKRDLKQAAMQQLLTGKTRMPGFRRDGGWKQAKIGKLPGNWRCASIPELVIRGSDGIKIGPFGSSLKEYLTQEGYKVYGQENVLENDVTVGNRYIDADRFRQLRSCEIRPGDFLVSMMGTVGKCMVAPEKLEPGIMDSHLLRLRLDHTLIVAAYLLQVFGFRIVLDQVKRLSVGAIMEGLSSSIVRRISIPLPGKAEQHTIATVLSDMDAETSRARGDAATKPAHLKQAMMQELLTGKTRLVPAEVAHA